MNQNIQYFEYEIVQHRLVSLLLFVLCVVALVLISILNLPIWIKTIFGLLLTVRMYYFWRSSQKSKFKKLIYDRQTWFLVSTDEEQRLEYELCKISKIFNLGFALNLKAKTASDATQIPVWKSNLSEEFSRFLSQAHQYGLANKK